MPDPSVSTSFLAAATSAPPAPAEIAPNAPAPAPSSPTPAPVTPSTTPEPPKPAETKPGTTAPETKPTPSETKPAESETKPEASDPEKVKSAPTAEQVKEEELSKEEVAKIGKMTPKELRAVFAARNRAEAEVRKLQPENEKLQKQVKEMATLKATIAELEKRPTTEQNDARIKAAESELATRKAEIEKIETDVRGREEKVRLREYATDVQKTEDYKKFITDPTKRLLGDLKQLCLGAADTEEDGISMTSQLEKVLNIDDSATRWREMKRIIADVDPADKAAFRKVHDDWNQILANYDQLAKNAEMAKQTVESDRKKQDELRSKDFRERVLKARKIVRPELEKEVPFMTMDLSGHPEYEKLRADGIKQMEEFDPATATPETISTLNDMAVSFQLAARVSRDFIKEQGEAIEKHKAEAADWKAKYEELSAKEKKTEEDEETEERETSEVMPTVSGGRESALPPFVPGGNANGKTGRFSEAVLKG